MTFRPETTAAIIQTAFFSPDEKCEGQRTVSLLSRISHGRRERPARSGQMLRQGCALLLFLLLGCLWLPAEAAASAGGLPETQTGLSVFRETDFEEPRVSFSQESGIYMQKRLTVILSAPEGYSVAYTTNGMIPGTEDDTGLSEVRVTLEKGGTGFLIENRSLMCYPEIPGSGLYDNPDLPSGKVLRAACVSPSGTAGTAETKVYFLMTNFAARYPGCLIVSIVTDPANLLDYETGSLAAGAVYDAWRHTESTGEHTAGHEIMYIESNSTQHGRAWERPCLLQLYDGGSTPAAELDAGIRVTGDYSRMMNQKSFNLYFRNSYGAASLDYELFPGISRYKNIRLRAGGNNTERLKFKDAFLQKLVSDRKFTAAESRPAVLFLNGEYWGPYLLSEKVTAEMLRDHHGVEKDQVVLIKDGELEDGAEEDFALYEELLSYAEKDLSDPAVWQAFCRIMDVQSMADYCAARIYFGDADWRQDRNDVLWRTRDRSFNDGRWQYVLYDVELSSGLYGNIDTAPETDHFLLAQERYPLFAAALENEAFRQCFLAALREIGTENCSYPRVLHLLKDYTKVWEPLMPDYYKRFGGMKENWYSAIDETRRFFRQRYELLLPQVEGFR